VEQPEIIPIAHAGHVAVETAAAEKRRLEIISAGDAAQVVLVEGVERDRGDGGEGREDDCLRAGVVARVAFVQWTLGPGAAAFEGGGFFLFSLARC